MDERWTLSEILMELDGAGLIITDQDEVERELNSLGFTGNSKVDFDNNISE